MFETVFLLYANDEIEASGHLDPLADQESEARCPEFTQQPLCSGAGGVTCAPSAAGRSEAVSQLRPRVGGIWRDAGASGPQSRSALARTGGSVSDSLELLAERADVKVSCGLRPRGLRWGSGHQWFGPMSLGGSEGMGLGGLFFLVPYCQPMCYMLIAGA